MNRKILVICDTRKIPQIKIACVSPTLQTPNPAKDRGVLCEALVTLIRCEPSNRLQADALRICLNHLKKGFIDESYKAEIKNNAAG